MTASFIIDATGTDPVRGEYCILDARDRTNAYDLWTEYLCLSPTMMPCLSTCVFGPIGEPPDDWYGEDGEVLVNRSIDGVLFPPAFYEGHPVACVESFVCGPLIVSPDGGEAACVPEEDGISGALDKLGWPITKELVRRIESAACTPVTSELPEGLVDAYLTTAYSANADNKTIELRVGEKCDALAPYRLRGRGHGAAFLTGWNPEGAILSTEVNRHRNRLLKADIDSVTQMAFPGVGTGSDKKWPPEDSFLAIGLTFEEAVHLGRHYAQNAIVWASEDAIPRLVLLR